eukprot:11177047-Lingulodinium_polyedra.AAC.1
MAGGVPRGPRGTPPAIAWIRPVPRQARRPRARKPGLGPGRARGAGSDPLIEPAPSVGERILHPSVPAFGSPAPGFRRR